MPLSIDSVRAVLRAERERLRQQAAQLIASELQLAQGRSSDEPALRTAHRERFARHRAESAVFDRALAQYFERFGPLDFGPLNEERSLPDGAVPSRIPDGAVASRINDAGWTGRAAGGWQRLWTLSKHGQLMTACVRDGDPVDLRFFVGDELSFTLQRPTLRLATAAAARVSDDSLRHGWSPHIGRMPCPG